MRSLGSAASMRVASRISLTLRSIEISLDSSMFLATCWVIVEAPTGRRLARNLPDIGNCGAHDRDRIDAVMAVKILVLGGEEGVDDRLGNRLDRHEDAPLGRIFGEQPAVTRMYPGHDRRLIMRELLVIRQVTTEIPQSDPDEPAAGNRQQDGADEQET